MISNASTPYIGSVGALTGRNVLKNVRNPDVIVFATAAPVAFALLFAFVFGSAMSIEGSAYRSYLLVGIIAQTMIITATNSGVALAQDSRSGLMERFRSLPTRPSAIVFGRVNSDVVMNLMVLVVLCLLGLLLGWRIESDPLSATAGLGLLLLFSYALSWATAYIGLKVSSPEVLSNAMMLVILPLSFVSNAFVPTDGMVSPLRVMAEWNPVSAVVASARELFGNQTYLDRSPQPFPLEYPIITSLLWIGLLLLVFIPLTTSALKNQNDK